MSAGCERCRAIAVLLGLTLPPAASTPEPATYYSDDNNPLAPSKDGKRSRRWRDWLRSNGVAHTRGLALRSDVDIAIAGKAKRPRNATPRADEADLDARLGLRLVRGPR